MCDDGPLHGELVARVRGFPGPSVRPRRWRSIDHARVALGIRQHPVGGADELKGLCEARVTVVMVGMKFMAQRFVGRPNHFGWRIACHFQIIVVRVQLLHCPVSDAMIPS